MRKILAVLLVVFALPVLAHGPYRPMPYRYHYHSNHGWVAPLIIGGAVGYALSRPTPNPPVIIQNLPPAPLGYHYEQVLDGNCNCYRWVLIAN